MATNIKVTSEKLKGYYYEIGLLTKEDSKNYQFKFITNKVLDEDKIKIKLEKITNCYVESVKRVIKYKRIRQQKDVERGVALTARYTLNNVKVRTDSLFLPFVRKQYINMLLLENEMKDFFGEDFELTVFSPR